MCTRGPHGLPGDIGWERRLRGWLSGSQACFHQEDAEGKVSCWQDDGMQNMLWVTASGNSSRANSDSLREYKAIYLRSPPTGPANARLDPPIPALVIRGHTICIGKQELKLVFVFEYSHTSLPNCLIRIGFSCLILAGS